MTDLVSLEGRVIIVTGAAQGIGKAISELVIKLGGAVVALDLNGHALKAAVKSFPAEPARLLNRFLSAKLRDWQFGA
jgi:3-oxoacyl-[acyl-carrier protein] reductase